MRYFVSYLDVFKNRDEQKRESFRLQTYNMLIRFLTRKQIEGNLITDEFAILKTYFESKEFTDTYFLSPYILNENQLSKDIISMITNSGETNTFNKIFDAIKDEVMTIKIGRNFITVKRIKVDTADKFLDMYLSDRHTINQLELTDKNEKKVLEANLIEGYNKGNEYLSILYITLKIKNAKTEEEMSQAIKLAETILESFPNNVQLILTLGDAYSSNLYQDENKYSKKFRLYSRAAELKDPCGMYLAGLCCFLGEGTTKDQEKALLYWTEAARLNNEDAISGMGVYYLSKGDKKSAKYWLTRSAEQGDYKALLLLDTDFNRL